MTITLHVDADPAKIASLSELMAGHVDSRLGEVLDCGELPGADDVEVYCHDWELDED